MLDETETELKLALADSAVARLRASDFWRGLRDDGTASNRSIYFDTADHRLRRNGFTLRQRQAGNRFEQTLKMNLKANGNGGLSRREWTWPLDQTGGPLCHLDEVEELQTLDGLDLSQLAPQCEVTYQRDKKVWQDNGVAVELALDVGEIRANGHRQPISELELELLSGPPAGLFALARTVNRIAPAHPFSTGKGTRGLQLLDPMEADGWRKPAPLHLDPDDTLDEALAQLFGNGLEHLLSNLDCARGGAHPEGIHQVRVAIRRLRTVLKMLSPVLPQARWVAMERRLGELADALGPVRDLDVFRETLQRVGPEAIDDDFAAGQLDRLAASMQGEAQAQATAALSGETFGGLLIDLTQWQTLRSWREQPVSPASARLFAPAGQVIGDGLDSLLRKVRKRGRRFNDLDEQQRHRLRLAIKRLRYGVDLFGSLFADKPTKRYRRTLVRLQDDLGSDNDAVVADAIVERMLERRPSSDVSKAAGAMLGWLRREGQTREDSLTRDWRDLVDRAPPWR